MPNGQLQDKNTTWVAIIIDFTQNKKPFIRSSFTGTYKECEVWRSQTYKEMQESYEKEWGVKNEHLRTIITSY